MEIREDEDLEVVDEVVDDTQDEEAIEKPDASEESEPVTIQDEDDEEEDRVVTIGDEEPEAVAEEEEAPDKGELVKKLRKVTRGLEKKNKALQRQIDANAKAAEVVKPIELGEKPTLKSCEYSDEKFEKAIIEYDARKRKVDAQEKQRAELAEEEAKTWNSRKEQYAELKQEHKFKDFDEAEELVSTTFSKTQQGIIIQGSKDAAILVYALGKNPKKLEELAKIKNPVDFTFAVANVEAQLKVKSKKAPAPEKRVSTGKAGGMSGNGDKTLDRLREEAAKTGDMTKVVAYKKKMRKDS